MAQAVWAVLPLCAMTVNVNVAHAGCLDETACICASGHSMLDGF